MYIMAIESVSDPKAMALTANEIILCLFTKTEITLGNINVKQGKESLQLWALKFKSHRYDTPDTKFAKI